jgi:hypothetical protein
MPTVITGGSTSYDNTVPQKRVVTDRILMAQPMEFPLLKALGINNSKFDLVNEPGKKYEWLEDEYAPLQDVLNDDTAVTNDTTDTTLSVGNGEYFHVGDIIQIDDEYMYVSAVSADDLTVTRGHGSTTQATHASTATVYIRSQARLEKASASNSPSVAISSGYNYSFILHNNVEVSRTDALLQRYGIPDLVDRDIDKKMNELMRLLTMKPYFGKRVEGTKTTPRDCGGFDAFISTNTKTMSSARLTRNAIEEMNRACFTAGQVPDLLVCGAFNQAIITDMFEGYVETMRSETLGGVTINRIMTSLGNTLDVLVDRYIPAANVYLLSTPHVGFIEIDPFFYEELGKTADTAAYGQIVGEYGFVMQWESSHAKISECATS